MPSTFPTYDISKPDATAQTLAQMGASMRDMETINRAAMACATMPGWTMTPSGGTATQPAVITWARGAEQVRETITWGSIGGALNNPQTIKYEYSNDSGSTWAVMFGTNGLETYSYDADGNCTGTTWS